MRWLRMNTVCEKTLFLYKHQKCDETDCMQKRVKHKWTNKILKDVKCLLQPKVVCVADPNKQL